MTTGSAAPSSRTIIMFEVSIACLPATCNDVSPTVRCLLTAIAVHQLPTQPILFQTFARGKPNATILLPERIVGSAPVGLKETELSVPREARFSAARGNPLLASPAMRFVSTLRNSAGGNGKERKGMPQLER
ncbi:hypothetical protein ACJ73_04097 [Blastomyces percursus]|uniref:Uncharacterized protein n=1 Tax=Blastomyces percursus TaxID=1658174 RepID=A0A1J9Q901_9EURO|nr:hypothetical protein ACJ73_04097 [Blastomyces percursus]